MPRSTCIQLTSRSAQARRMLHHFSPSAASNVSLNLSVARLPGRRVCDRRVRSAFRGRRREINESRSVWVSARFQSRSPRCGRLWRRICIRYDEVVPTGFAPSGSAESVFQSTGSRDLAQFPQPSATVQDWAAGRTIRFPPGAPPLSAGRLSHAGRPSHAPGSARWFALDVVIGYDLVAPSGPVFTLPAGSQPEGNRRDLHPR